MLDPSADPHAGCEPQSRPSSSVRDGEHLTTAGIATPLDRPVKQVAAVLDTAPPGTYHLEIVERWEAAPPLHAVSSRYGDVTADLRRDRRRRRGLIGLALALGTGVAVGLIMLPTIVDRLDPPDVRERG